MRGARRVAAPPRARGSSLHGERHLSADAFLARARSWLLRAEVENNVLLGVAEAFRGRDGAEFVTVEAEGRLVACAGRVPPRGLVASAPPERPPGTAEALLDGFGAALTSLPSVMAPDGPAQELAAAWCARTGGRAWVRVRQRLYALAEVDPALACATGRLRPARLEDLESLTLWVSDFLRDVETSDPTPPRELARQRLASGDLHVWEEGGVPVSMAGATGRTEHTVRVSLVYTPPEQRRKGFARACVAALSQALLDRGFRACCLYADREAPGRAALYTGIGYRPVVDALEISLKAAPASGRKTLKVAP